MQPAMAGMTSGTQAHGEIAARQPRQPMQPAVAGMPSGKQAHGQVLGPQAHGEIIGKQTHGQVTVAASPVVHAQAHGRATVVASHVVHVVHEIHGSDCDVARSENKNASSDSGLIIVMNDRVQHGEAFVCVGKHYTAYTRLCDRISENSACWRLRWGPGIAEPCCTKAVRSEPPALTPIGRDIQAHLAQRAAQDPMAGVDTAVCM